MDSPAPEAAATLLMAPAASTTPTRQPHDVADTTTSRSYGGDAGHNRLQGLAQTTAPGANTVGDLLGDGHISYQYDSQGRMESATTVQGTDAPRTKYAHNGLGQRVFKTEPLYSSAAASLRIPRPWPTCWPMTTKVGRPNSWASSSNQPVAAPSGGPVFAQADLPESVRTQLPTLKISGATHSNNPAYRMAIVNGQVLHEGDQAAPDLVLERIKPGRTVCAFRGYRYRYGVASQ